MGEAGFASVFTPLASPTFARFVKVRGSGASAASSTGVGRTSHAVATRGFKRARSHAVFEAVTAAFFNP